MRLNMNRKGLFLVGGGTDRVVAAVPVPAGGSLLQVGGSVSIMPVAAIPIDAMTAYSLNMYVIPVPDFDTPVTLDVLWDNIVPKDDDATDTLDLDEAGSGDTNPEFEVGSPDLETILGIHGTNITRVFGRKRFLSYGSHPMFSHINSTPFFWPAEDVPVRINRKVRVQSPSMVVLGMSAPALDITVTTLQSTPTLAEWGRMSFLKDTLTDMVKNSLGLVEAGAETPYEEAQALIVKLLETNVIEEAGVAAHLLSTAYNVYSKLNFKIDMPEVSVGGELTAG